jgi:hypothetical protein
MEEQRLGFLHTIFGLGTTPLKTATRLMEDPQPPHILRLSLAILLTMFLPVSAQIYSLELDSMRQQMWSSLAIIVFFSFIIFTLFEMIFLQVLGIDMRLHQMMASVIYAITPLMMALWAVYITNYYFDGSITIVTKLLTTHGIISKPVVAVLNVGVYYALFFGLLIFSACVKSVTEGNIISAILVSILSLAPGYACLVLGVSLAETAIPGTLQSLIELDQIFDILSKIREE